MKRTLRALLLSVTVVAATMTGADASHPTVMCLDIDPEETWAFSDDDVVDSLRAYPGATDAGHPPEHEGCVTEHVESGQNWGGTNLDFEVTGASDPDASDSPTTPDLTCTIPFGSAFCFVDPPPSGGGAQSVRGWIDFDLNDATVEADVSESRDEIAAPGDTGEPDGTDVVVVNWMHRDPPPPPCGADDVCERRITIDYRKRNGTFFGELKGEFEACQTSRVTVMQVREGRDKVVIETGDSGGTWRARTHESHRGRFYAVLGKSYAPIPNTEPPAAHECLKDRSRTIRTAR